MSSILSIKSPIARRFILYIVLFSSLITLFITAFQLYRDYNTDIELIHTELDQVDKVHLSSLTSALWTSNLKLLQTSIEGILNLRDIQYVEIRDEEKLWVTAGEIKDDNNIQRSYSMDYHHRNRDIHIGILTVNVSLAGVYQRMIDKVWVILISNTIKTFLIAIFIYFLFYRLVARHLSAISEFSEKHQALTNNTHLSLNRSNKSYDEFDAVVKSINDMHTRLYEQVSEINRQKQYLSQTLNSIGDAVITTDEQGNVTRLNPVAEQLTGWKNDEALKRPLKTIFPIVNASTRESIPNPVEKVLTTGETVYLSNHTTLIAKNGDEYQIADSAAPILDDKKILGMVLVFNDVTEQYQLRQALRESEKKLRLIHSQVPGIVYQFKVDANGKKIIPYVSPAVENYIGLTVQTIMDDAGKWFELIHPDDYPGLEASIIESQKNLSVWNWEGRFIRGDGKMICLRGTSTPERLDDGSTLWNGLFIDVTERRLQEEQLRRSQKMDALGKLTGGIAHDYNNILGIVLGYAEQINDHLQDTDKVARYSQNIKHAAERGSKLAKKLLSFSRHKQPDETVVNINSLLQEHQHMLEKTLTVSHKLTLDLMENLWLVEMDSSDLEDAVLNISINALHAMKSGGQLTISTSNEQLNAKDVEQLNINQGDYVLLSIADTGCGMDTETREKIFDPFYTTKEERGTGLGLSQVYGFIQRCGGTIKVYSEKGHGSRFVLYFPRSDKPISNEQQGSTEIVANMGGNETLLVVDDEQAMVDLAYDILTVQGYHVLTANDGEQALALLEKKAFEKENIDLIISDVIMPNMDGYQLAAQVRKHYPHIKLQMVSGFADERHNGRVDIELHMNMLQKPYASNTLLKRVRLLLDERNEPDVLSNRIILTLDDDEDTQTLYEINLKKLGCRVISVFNSQEAIDTYRNALETDTPIDVIIVDLSIPGDMSGDEVKDKIRKFHSSAKVVVASGNLEGPEMSRPQDFGFDGALKKNFNTENIRHILEQVLIFESREKQ